MAIDANIRVEPVPGPNAAIAALAVSGLPGDSFAFLGFPPVRSSARTEWFRRLKTIGGTIVFYEAPHRIKETLQRLLQEVGNRDVVVARELTKVHEELVRGPISAVAVRIGSAPGEFTVVVDVGRTTESAEVHAPVGERLLAEFGELTNNARFTRRKAVSVLAKRYGIAANTVYAMLENAKRSVE
jgi:16S rRNA (cytidine1402-2'-O)-methyltransferase